MMIVNLTVLQYLSLFQTEWIHRYEACGEYIQKMTPDDFVEFVHTITFSEQIISQVCTILT